MFAAPSLVAAARPDVGAAGEAGEGDVQVVGRSAHHPGGRRGGDLERAPARRSRSSFERGMTCVTLTSEPSSGEGTSISSGMLVLEIEDPRDRLGCRREERMLERVRDPLAVQPELALVAGELVEELLAGAGANRGGGLTVVMSDGSP